MLSRDNLVILIVALIAASLGGWWQYTGRLAPMSSEVTMPQAGEPAPELNLPGLDGKLHRLTDFRGHRVLLNFWASWCGPCLDEMPMLAKTQANFGDQGVIVLGIAMDDPARTRAFLAVHPVNYPILLGRLAAPSTSLIWGDSRELLPYSVLIDTNGRMIATHTGPLTPSLLEHWLAPLGPKR